MIIHDMEQGTDEWFAARLGIPTASNAKMLVSSTGKESTQFSELARKLAADKYAGEELDKWEGNSATQRGTELEPEAVLYYEMLEDVETEVVGFITDDDNNYGCSPDRLVGDKGMLEIKCQQAKGHMKTIDYIDKHEKAPPDYIPQCQMQMYVTGREWCDLFYYHPQLPSMVVRQYPDDEFIATLEVQIANTLAERDRLIQIMENS